MRRYQNWLSVGLLAVTPHLALADDYDSPADAARPAAAAPKKASGNQELAERVAKALRKAQLNQYEIDIDVRSGVVTLVGTIAKPEQRKAAEKAVSSVPGVTKVIDRLEVASNYSKGAVQQAAAAMPRSPVGSSQYIRQAGGNRPSYGGIEPGPIPGGPAAMPAPYAEPQRMAYAANPPAQLAQVPVNAYPASNAGPGAYCPPNMAGGGANMPNGAWPTSAQYPNYAGAGAGAGYGPQSAASAWPYAGPYYPYPQIPIGWRKASLEWDDGYWNLNFRSRTDRWWWYLNPQNW